MEIRQATKQDIPQLISLNQEVQSIHVRLFPEVFGRVEKEEVEKWFCEILDNQSTIVLVAEDEEALVAYIIFRKQIRPAHVFRNERECGYIDQVCVTELYRRRGILKAFMNEVKGIAKKWELDRIELDVWSDNAEAKKAFIACGFKTYNEKMEFVLSEQALDCSPQGLPASGPAER